MNTEQFELVVIGAGPAGMSAATTAARLGLVTLLVDEQPRPGGQIYRNIGKPVLKNEKILGPDYYYGSKLLEAFSGSSCSYLAGATVWEVTSDNIICISVDGESRRIGFKKLLIATGAQERPVPFPGWTLPGVMTCGAAQILLKASGLTPPGPLVIAGSGPLLLLIACQLVRAGVRIDAILETTPRENYFSALSEIAGAVKGWRYLLKGAQMLAELRKAGVQHLKGITELKAEPDAEGNLARTVFVRKGKQEGIDCNTLLVHQGVIPNTQLTRSVNLEHIWDEGQQCWKPRLGPGGQSSAADIFVAGDSAGIGGALVAEMQGRLSALDISMSLHAEIGPAVVTEQRQLRHALKYQLAIRPFLDRLYSPAQAFLVPPDETVVCRCEEVTAKEIRSLTAQGCSGPNQTKAFCRAGMGPCQGRQCGMTVSNLLADELKSSPSQVGYYNIRPPIKPLTLGELASIADSQTVEHSISER